MKKKLSVKSVIGWIITVVICAFIAIAITNELVPQPQFTVELAEAQNQVVTVYTYHDQGTPFPCTQIGPDTYACDIPQGYWKNAYHLVLAVDTTSSRVISASINDKSASPGEIVNVGDIISYLPYSKTAVIIAAEITATSLTLFFAVSAALLTLCFFLNCEIKKSGYGNLRKTILCGGSGVKAIGKKGFLLALVGVIISCLIAVGRDDINIILGDLRLFGKGTDLYQYMATVNQRNQISLLMWTYNPPMLMAYFLGTIPLQIGHFVTGSYHIVCYLFYKLLNGALILVTVVSILSFMEKRGMISLNKCKSVFLWSFFNPLVFYVAIVYIQLDAFPTCCLALGCLLFAERKTPVLAGALLGIGAACKMQCFLLIPPVLVMFLWGILKRDKEERAMTWKAAVAFAVTMALCLAPLVKTGSPFALMMQYNPQAERAWWTTLQYAPVVFFLITPAVLICAMIADMVHLDLGKKPDTLVLNTFYMFGAIVLLFSFSILSTPSTLIHCLAAFTILNVAAKDRFQRLMIGGLSLLMVFEIMFTSIGDVAKLLGYVGIQFNFTMLEQSLNGTDQGVRLFSLLFTISHAAMLAYGVLFCKKAIDTLRSDDGNGCQLMPHIEK